MELAIINTLFKNRAKKRKMNLKQQADLTCAKVNCPYLIKGIDTNDKETKKFLFTLGCYEGEKVTVISILAHNYIIHVRNARYSIDKELAQAILI